MECTATKWTDVVAEDCSGNQTTHTQTITVVDLVAPVISGGEDYTAEYDGNAAELANWLAGQEGPPPRTIAVR